jgi:hypothetical protein
MPNSQTWVVSRWTSVRSLLEPEAADELIPMNLFIATLDGRPSEMPVFNSFGMI